MITEDRMIVPLWDFGWLDYSRLTLPRFEKPSAAINAYLRSEEFATSFVGPKRDHFQGLHGPFRMDALSEGDFEALSLAEFQRRIATVRQPDGFTAAASPEQWLEVEGLVREVGESSTAFYGLRFTEADRSRFHEWGHVLNVFREFIGVDRDQTTIQRLVFGYD